jgi:hypothetical protein
MSNFENLCDINFIKEFIKLMFMNRKTKKPNPESITRNSSTSGKTLILDSLRLRMRRRGWLG